ncbi:MAG: TetR/AcrR family transcriptional regulator [Pseudolysinimonas sp.]
MTSSQSAPDSGPLDIDEVLDAASDMFVNDGFDAMSLRSIAGHLDIDESELTNLFESMESLLVGMLNREYTGMFHAIVDDIERDPLGGRMSRIYRYVLSAVYERPLARSLYLMDRDGLHRIMRATHGFAYIPQLSVRSDFIDRMKVAGAVRNDIDSAAVSAVIAAVSAGTALLAPDQPLSDVVDGLAVLLERGVDTDTTDTSRGKAEFFAYASSLTGDGDGTQNATD